MVLIVTPDYPATHHNHHTVWYWARIGDTRGNSTGPMAIPHDLVERNIASAMSFCR